MRVIPPFVRTEDFLRSLGTIWVEVQINVTTNVLVISISQYVPQHIDYVLKTYSSHSATNKSR